MSDMLKCIKCNRWSKNIQSSPTQLTPSALSGPSTTCTQIQPCNIHTAGPLYLPIPHRSLPALDTRTHIFYKGLAQEAHVQKKADLSTPKFRCPSCSCTPDPKPSPEKRFVKAGVSVYIDDVLQKKTGIIPKLLEVNTQKPKFYEDFCHHLWGLFSEKILSKTQITYPPNPCVDKGTSSPFPPAHAPAPPKGAGSDQPRASKAATWALGGKISTKPARGATSLLSQFNTLSHPVGQSIVMKTDGWIPALSVHFYTINEQPPSGALHKSSTINDYICVVTFPFEIKVKSGKVLGEGSSCRSFAAQVRSLEQGKEIFNKGNDKCTPSPLEHTKADWCAGAHANLHQGRFSCSWHAGLHANLGPKPYKYGFGTGAIP
ncbi:uncharacterized protein PGTG_04967 [Puccinia graminis f. sp. tritici CRL 75-36-700-3]|uniref:Uncharacterized protein n=1 Tax=Puccinia graminis f. sp. tritici (strain CRL 75-36-700-3 / race SCCL) TaxID=418459 RepID=E3K3F4_PUCGT|nr:uncharacterized protein PGTG_04967 [Puccinia graminis f. sp. tritici CRL 75-36-700-3]EFP79011.1 hypothetical protein PGTG_04967 [Puccinia graminis f. sp. tritici CRL 75-36-700-3]